MTTDSPRLLIYSQDGLGLGHLRRTTLLAAEYLAARPDASVVTISDSPIGQFFTAAPGHDFVKLPSIRKVSPGNWSPVRLESLHFNDVLSMRAEIIKTTALAFEPDVLLVDHMPHGAMGELVPTLEAFDTRPVRTVLGLRDILDAPETVRRRWHLEGAFEVLRQHFDDVFVYGSQDVFDVASHYAWEPDISRRLSYCGYVCSPPSAGPTEPIRRQYLGDDDAELIVAMAGGGADAYPLFDTLLDAMPALQRERNCQLVIVTGPFLPATHQEDLRQRASGLPVHVVPSVQDSLGHMAAADLIVAMGGYNTTAEVLSVGRPALLVPRAGPSAEQTMRVSRFAEREWLRWLPPEELSAPALATSMVDALTTPLQPVGTPDLSGRLRAAELLHEQVEYAIVPASGGG
ncbi:glycosyltransferase family protein [Aeromicrobium sp.]|uniref:glycosyltransferase family protein n=1 Tax=Aeromicrobium sp. TaxID=1871063 RepID=UPI003D6AD631